MDAAAIRHRIREKPATGSCHGPISLARGVNGEAAEAIAHFLVKW